MAGYVRNELRSTSKCRLVLNLHVEVRLAAVAGVAHAGDLLAAANVGARRDARAGALEVREHQVAPGSEPDHEVVAGGVVRVGLADRRRRGELIGLRWDEVDLASGVIRVQ